MKFSGNAKIKKQKVKLENKEEILKKKQFQFNKDQNECAESKNKQ